jgi:gliding motility-associated-like protein
MLSKITKAIHYQSFQLLFTEGFKFSVTCLLTLCLSNLSANAQCGTIPSITLSGSTCVGGELKALSSVPGSTIIWKVNSTKTVATQTITASMDGITVAGGNGNGSGNHQLSNPNRIFIDKDDNIYIPDMSNSRIVKWAPGATSGITVAGGNGVGSAANQFDRPTSVFVDSKGNIYVTDQTNSRVQKWVPGATSGVTVASLGWSSSPTGVFMDAAENLYVSEQNNSLVSKWMPGATKGITIAGGNGYGSGVNQLSTPTGIFVDASGNVYICDTDNNRVQKWAPGATTGITVAGGNGYGSAANQLANPLGVYVDANSNVYVTDFNNYRVQKWAPGATSGVTVAGGNGSGNSSNQFNQPAGISMDSKCNLYVTDFYNHRIQKFSTTATNTHTTLEPGDYTATLVTPSGSTIVSNTITVLAQKIPQITITTDKTTVCPNASATFNAIPTDGGSSPSYQWTKNGANVGTNAASYFDASISDGDKISCMLTSNASCLSSTTNLSNTIVMQVQKTHTSVNLGPDINLCAGKQIAIEARAGYSSYLWQDGSTSASFSTSLAGKYHVKVQDACGGSSSDTITITIIPNPAGFIPKDTSFCNNGSLELMPLTSTFKQYLWSTNAQTQNIEVRVPGMYWLQVTDQHGCSAKEFISVTERKCASRFYVPSSFTPNGDGKNDLLRPIFLDNLKQLNFTIYNRWGLPVFSTKKINQGWDGRLDGILQSTGVFTWICTYQFAGEPMQTEKGTITLVR